MDPLEERAQAPPDPEPLGADTREAQRRGSHSYALHAKLGSRLYVREGQAECQTVRLPSSTGRVALDERGTVWVADKTGRSVSRIVDGKPVDVFAASEDQAVVALYAARDVLWVKTSPRLAPGTQRATPETVHRVDGDRVTHTTHLPLTATTIGGTADRLGVLDENGSVHLFTVVGDSLVATGPYDENFTGVHEWNGELALVSHWHPGRSWIVTGQGDRPAEEAPVRLDTLPGELRASLLQRLRDGANPDIHRALEGLPGGDSSVPREQRMARAGEQHWAAVRDGVVADIERLHGLTVTGGLEADLARATVSCFLEAARW